MNVDVARVSIRPGRQSFLLIAPVSAERQQKAWEVLSALREEGTLHVDVEVTLSPELLLVIPPAIEDASGLVQIILRELAARASIVPELQEMPAQEFATYDVFAILARKRGQGGPRGS